MIDNFIKVASFCADGTRVDCILEDGVDRYQRISLVYMMVVEDDIRYIGKTIQGLIRPLSYHKNDVMKDVKSGIHESVNAGKQVDVYCRMFDNPLMFEGLELDICEAYEQALISKYKPAWNNHIR